MVGEGGNPTIGLTLMLSAFPQAVRGEGHAIRERMYCRIQANRATTRTPRDFLTHKVKSLYPPDDGVKEKDTNLIH